MFAILGLLGFFAIVVSIIYLIVSSILFFVKKIKHKPIASLKKMFLYPVVSLCIGMVLFSISVSSGDSETASTNNDQSEQEEQDKQELPKVSLSTDKTEYETNEKAVATITGKTEPGTQLVMTFDTVGLGNPEDTEKKDIKVNDDGTFSVDVNLATDYSFYASKEGKDDNEVTVSVKHSKAAQEYIKQQEEKKKQEEINKGKENAKQISYNHLKKNADNYKGEPYFIKGQVIQALEENGTTLLRVNITNKGYGFYDDTMAVLVNGTTDAVEDDIVEVFGTITGNFSYESTIGANITIPGMSAEPSDVKIVK